MAENSDLVRSVQIEDLPTFEVTEGIIGRNLPTTDLVRAWVYDFAPDTEWPEVDHHAAEERYWVVSGEIVDNGTVYPAGSHVVFAPGSSHRPASRTGARMLGISDARG